MVRAYTELSIEYGSDTTPLGVAVRSSATAEDLPTASFAGRRAARARHLRVRLRPPRGGGWRRGGATEESDAALHWPFL